MSPSTMEKSSDERVTFLEGLIERDDGSKLVSNASSFSNDEDSSHEMMDLGSELRSLEREEIEVVVISSDDGSPGSSGDKNQ